ncbi:MAG: hypothetical protein ACPGUC_08265 [Gammaproteobacteria bacterium]
MTTYRVPGLIGLLLSTGLTGCAVGNVGTLSATVVRADEATVVDVRSLGLHLRLDPPDWGLSIGSSRLTYVFPPGTTDAPPPGEYIGLIPKPAATPLVFSARTLGLDLKFTPPLSALTLGAERYTLLANIPADRSVRYDLVFVPDRPELTRLNAYQEINQ